MMARKNVREAAKNPDVAVLENYILGEIGTRIREFYDEILKEGVTDRFVALLKRLDDPVDQGEPGRNAELLKFFDDSNCEGK